MSEILRLHELPNGRKVDVIHLTFGRARVCLVSPNCDVSYDDEW